jgi:hypothetical protein
MPLLTHSQEPPARSERDGADAIRFCSRCGGADDVLPGRPELRRRVCERCGMGVMLTSQGDALPSAGAAFVVVTAELAVSAVSRSGDKLFGEEGELIGSHLLSLLTCPLGDPQLEQHVRRAATTRCETVALPVRLVPDGAPRVGTLSARIGTCSSPQAALVAVEPSGFGIR